MKYAKKMVAITEEEYNKLKGCKEEKKLITYKQNMARRIVKTQNNLPNIEGYFHPDHQSRVRNLLDELKSTGLKVNSKREIILPYGDTIPGSDIVSLMKELFIGATLSREKPAGWQEFTNAVANSSAPLAMISKGAARGVIKKIRNETMMWDEY